MPAHPGQPDRRQAPPVITARAMSVAGRRSAPQSLVARMPQRRPRTSHSPGIGFSDPHRGVVERLGTELLAGRRRRDPHRAKVDRDLADADRVGRHLSQRLDIHGVPLVERRDLRDTPLWLPAVGGNAAV